MPTIQLRTQVPGPKSLALWEKRKAVVARGLTTLHPVFIEQTHRAHTGFLATSRVRRNSGRSRLTMTSSGVTRLFPTASWKKQGRTDPSASITTDVHGALQLTAGKGPAPASAA